MNFAFIFLIYRFFYRIKEFLIHWYVDSIRIYWDFVLDKLARIDYYLAWRVTFRHFFHPLFKDYSIIGYIMGFIFRFCRLVVATVIYVFIFSIAIVLYFLWLLALPYILYRAVGIML